VNVKTTYHAQGAAKSNLPCKFFGSYRSNRLGFQSEILPAKYFAAPCIDTVHVTVVQRRMAAPMSIHPLHHFRLITVLLAIHCCSQLLTNDIILS